jgi:hypothetical protein
MQREQFLVYMGLSHLARPWRLEVKHIGHRHDDVALVGLQTVSRLHN